MKKIQLEVSAIARFKCTVWRMKFSFARKVKRAVDVLFSALALILLSPLLAMTALAITLESKGGAIFMQKRVGLNGKLFMIWKFRSMVVDAESQREKLESSNEMVQGVLFKIKHDPRVTKVGSLIRKTSIDELPQLFNVLKGDMSLVGPRPPLPNEVSNYKRLDCRRLQALPGITCEWQVNGRSTIPFDKQVEMDIHYIRNQSLYLDLVLIIKTIPAVLFARGAY